MDFDGALASITVKRLMHRYRGEKIGVVQKDFCQGFYKRGEIVLVKRNSEGFFSVEKPLSHNMMYQEKRKGSVISSIGLQTGVPQKYVREVQR